MEKFPFNQTGIEQLLGQLYQYPDSQLAAEAASAETDFRNWLIAKFDFNEMQTHYLTEMSDSWMNDSGHTTSIALKNRLPIMLEPPEPRVPPRPYESSKYVRTINKLVFSDNNGATYSGSITFQIEYL